MIISTEMRNVQLRMRLRMKLDEWGKYKKGDEDIFFFNILDEQNGLSRFSIDCMWEIVKCDEYTGLSDMEERWIYEGDILKNKFGIYVVEFADGCFWACNVNEEDNVPLYVHNEDSLIVGNIHQEHDWF